MEYTAILSTSKCILCLPSPREDASGEKCYIFYCRASCPQKARWYALSSMEWLKPHPPEAQVWRRKSSHRAAHIPALELTSQESVCSPRGSPLSPLVPCFHQQVGKDFWFAILETRKVKLRSKCFINMSKYTWLPYWTLDWNPWLFILAKVIFRNLSGINLKQMRNSFKMLHLHVSWIYYLPTPSGNHPRQSVIASLENPILDLRQAISFCSSNSQECGVRDPQWTERREERQQL